MQNIWEVTNFVSEIKYLKGHPKFKNRSSLLDMAPMYVSLKILQMNLWNRTFYAKFYMSGCFRKLSQLVTSPKANLTFKAQQYLQTLTAASWRGWGRKMGNF